MLTFESIQAAEKLSLEAAQKNDLKCRLALNKGNSQEISYSRVSLLLEPKLQHAKHRICRMWKNSHRLKLT